MEPTLRLVMVVVQVAVLRLSVETVPLMLVVMVVKVRIIHLYLEQVLEDLLLVGLLVVVVVPPIVQETLAVEARGVVQLVLYQQMV